MATKTDIEARTLAILDSYLENDYACERRTNNKCHSQRNKNFRHRRLCECVYILKRPKKKNNIRKIEC